MNISIVIPTVDRVDSLDALLSTLAAQSIIPYEIIIIEQGSRASERLQEKYNTLPIHYFHVAFRSLPAARNFGVDKSTGSIVGFLDDDILLDKEYIKNIMLFFEQHPSALGVQGVITNFREGHIKKVGGNSWFYSFYNVLAKIFLLNNS